MALQSSGQISLDDIHVEAGGTTSTLAAINDSDIRGLIGATSESEMEFSDWYGASGAQLDVRGTTQNVSSRANIDTSISSSLPVNLTGQSIQTGDLVFICVASRSQMDGAFTWAGMTLTDGFGSTGAFASPGRAIAYGTWASGNSNPYISTSPEKNGNHISQQTAIFSNAGGVIQSATSDQQNTSGSTIPTPNLSTYSGSATPAGFITVLMADTSSATGNSSAGVTAPSGYTMAASETYLILAKQGYRGSFLAIAYKASTSTSAETVGNWGMGTDLSSATNYYSTATFRVGA